VLINTHSQSKSVTRGRERRNSPGAKSCREGTQKQVKDVGGKGEIKNLPGEREKIVPGEAVQRREMPTLGKRVCEHGEGKVREEKGFGAGERRDILGKIE